MIHEGQLVLFSFPQTDLAAGKLRPALVLRRLPGPHDDWLVCMISSQLRCEVRGVDEVLFDTDEDFPAAGLKLSSVIRITRVAVVAAASLQGAIGELSKERLTRIQSRLAEWMVGTREVRE